MNSSIIKKALRDLPKKGPYGKEVAVNKERTIIISCLITSEEASPKAEMHENYNDTLFIVEGEEEFFVCGDITDKKSSGPGEWSGEILKGASKYCVKKGDILVIPKGIPHKHGKGIIKSIIVKTS